MERIGILGGTFNPPHVGHLVLAASAVIELDLDLLILMPSGDPPHKTGNELADAEDRYQMSRLLVKDRWDMSVSDFETLAEGKSYTAKTLREIREVYPTEVIYFIVGADALCEMDSWYHPEEIFSLANIAVAMRPGTDPSEVQRWIDIYVEKYGAHIARVNAPLLDLSSSDIRERIKHGESVDEDLMPDVYNYIKENHIYTTKIYHAADRFKRNND